METALWKALELLRPDIQAAEARRRALRKELARLAAMRQALTDWQGLLRHAVPEARRALKALLAGRVVFSPQEDAQRRYYAFEGPGTVRRIIAGLVGAKGMVTPAGFEPAISTLKGSRPGPG